MGDVIHRRLNILVSAVLGIIILMTALLCFKEIQNEFCTPDINLLRSDMAVLVQKLEEKYNAPVSVTDPPSLSNDTLIASELFTGLDTFSTDIPFALIDMSGNVIYNKGTDLHERLNLHMINLSDTGVYSVPLLKNDSVSGFLYVEIPDSYYGTNITHIILCILFCLCVILLSILIYTRILRILRLDIFLPITQLNLATKSILNGQPDTPVCYDYDGEIGGLCHDFELMRTELCDSLNREHQLKNDEKLLMASISHDLKTPLATVQGYLESICLDIVTEQEAIKNYCKNALEKTLLLGNMTNDILEHSKAELHQLSIVREEVYTSDFFGALTQTLTADAKSRGFSFTSSPIPNVIIAIDKTRITQIIENIVGNSYKYCKEEPLNNTKGHINISFSENAGRFHIKINDDGLGIAAEDIPFVFNRFFRGDKARTQSIAGSGLGLSIAKYIVEQHDGIIECDSILGQGTTIEFFLPVT